jgi:LPS export ABC transporter protein LptC
LTNRCRDDKIDEALPQQLPTITLEKFCLTETKNGNKLWILNAEAAWIYEEIIEIDRVQIQFFDENQVEFSVLYAPAGQLNTKTHNILVGDSVVVITNDSTTLYTDSLFWQNNSGVILTNSPVQIVKHDGTIIEGRGLKTDPYLKKIEIIGTTEGVSPIELPDINK